MAKEGSVAPKERVNIRYKPATGDAKEEVELPMKTLVLGDFTLRPDDTPLEDRQRVSIDKNNFNDVMRSHKLSLDLKVKDVLSDDADAELPVQLKVETLKSMEPEEVARQVPQLQKLLELRDALAALKGPLGNMPEFRKTLQRVIQDDGSREQLLKELAKDGDEAAGA